jgi:hypothetical protein
LAAACGNAIAFRALAELSQQTVSAKTEGCACGDQPQAVAVSAMSGRSIGRVDGDLQAPSYRRPSGRSAQLSARPDPGLPRVRSAHPARGTPAYRQCLALNVVHSSTEQSIVVHTSPASGNSHCRGIRCSLSRSVTTPPRPLRICPTEAMATEYPVTHPATEWLEQRAGRPPFALRNLPTPVCRPEQRVGVCGG